MNVQAHESDIQIYKVSVDIFKGYLDTALTANIWFYTLTGAVVANYLTDRGQQPYLKFSLIVPALFGVALTSVSLIGLRQANLLEARLNKAVTVELRNAPPAKTLKWFLGITSGLSILILFGIR